MKNATKGLIAAAIAAALLFFHATPGPAPLTWDDQPQQVVER